MNEPTTDGTRVFGPSKNMLVVMGCFLAFFLVISIVVLARDGEWRFLALTSAGAAFLLSLPLVVRLEIGPRGLRHRTPLGWKEIEFDSVTRASIEALNQGRGQGAATLYMESRDGRSTRIFLRRYPIEVSVAVLDALESHGVEVVIPDRRALYWAEQVRAAQAARAQR